MSEQHAKKISVSLPIEVFNDLDALAHFSGVSRSALLSAILANVLPDVRDSVVSLSHTFDPASSGAYRRYRTSSKDLIDSYVSSLRGELQHDLFQKTK
jgi:hypothetical protein